MQATSSIMGTWSRAAMLFSFLIIALVSINNNSLFSDKSNVIKWDGYGYYVYLPALLIYNNDDFDFVDEHMVNYEISDNVYQVRTLEDGQKSPTYNIGLSILWLPFFLLAHLIAHISSYTPDGLSPPYQWMIIISSLFYILIGLYYLRRFLSRFLTDKIVALTILGIALGTNYFYYATDGIELTHIYLFTLIAIYLYYTHSYFETNDKKDFLYIGLTLGLMTLVRSSEILLILIPALWGFSFKDLGSDFLVVFKKHFIRGLKLLLPVVAIFSIQLLYYKYNSGHWFVNGYADHYFDLLHPHIYECLIGFRRGWLIYTPLMILGLLGFYFLWRQESKFFWGMSIFLLLNCYILFSWDIWWYGNTFGCRPIVQSYAILALPLGLMLAFLWKHSSYTKGLGYILLLSFISLNLFQTWQYHKRIIPLDFVNEAYYKEVFFKTKKDKRDYILLDIPEQLPKSKKLSSTLFQSKQLIESKGTPSVDKINYTNILELKVSENNLLELSDNWLNSKLNINYDGNAYNKWHFPSLVTQILRGKKSLKYTALRIPHVINSNEDSLSYAQQLPELKEGDLIKIFLSNNSQDNMTLETLAIELWK